MPSTIPDYTPAEHLPVCGHCVAAIERADDEGDTHADRMRLLPPAVREGFLRLSAGRPPIRLVPTRHGRDWVHDRRMQGLPVDCALCGRDVGDWASTVERLGVRVE